METENVKCICGYEFEAEVHVTKSLDYYEPDEYEVDKTCPECGHDNADEWRKDENSA